VGVWSLLRGRPAPEPVIPDTAPVIQPLAPEKEPSFAPAQPSAPGEEAQPEVPARQPSAPAEIPPAPAVSPNVYLAQMSTLEAGVETVTRYLYDKEGRLAWEDTGDGYIHTYSYRADGTLEKEGITLHGEPFCVILCDDFGNPLQESDLDGYTKTHENTYDAAGRLVSSQARSAGGVLLEEAYYTYAQDGSHTLDYIDHAEGMLHCHKFTAYDSSGRILTQSQDLESGMPVLYRTDHTYDAFGNLTRTEYTYDDGDLKISRLTEYENTCDANGTLLSSTVYITEQQTSAKETFHTPRKPERLIAYVYDENHRLIRQENQGTDGSWRYVYSWEYDEAGNLLHYTEGDGELAKTYTYLPLEQLRYSYTSF